MEATDSTSTSPDAADSEGAAATVILPASPSQTATFVDLYPERRGKTIAFTKWQLFTGNAKIDSYRRICENHVVSCLEDMPMVRTMIGALEAQGCPLDLDRHLLCDICKPEIESINRLGGYDDQENQVFVCANSADSVGAVHGVLVRNLMHMFDRCVSKVDFRNVDHLACMEVRKANLANCGFLVYMCRSDARIRVKREHQQCVRSAALESLIKTKFVEESVAIQAIDRVFNKCYKDLEPYGRRCRNSDDIHMAHSERYLFGYK